MAGMAPSPGTDWTEDERAHIGRLETLCRSIEHWEMECSSTDAGDPWCVIYDRDGHRIVLHIARIERRYVVVWPPRRRLMNTATMNAAVDIALAELVSATS
jgi:hypothetical protein